MTCVSCHNYTKAATPMATGAQTAHINNGTDANLGNFRCVDCHVNTVMTNNSAINYTNGKHVNGTKDVNIKVLNTYTGAYVSASFVPTVAATSSASAAGSQTANSDR